MRSENLEDAENLVLFAESRYYSQEYVVASINMCATSREIEEGSSEKVKHCSRGRGSALWKIRSVDFVDSFIRGILREMIRETVAYAGVELIM